MRTLLIRTFHRPAETPPLADKPWSAEEQVRVRYFGAVYAYFNYPYDLISPPGLCMYSPHPQKEFPSRKPAPVFLIARLRSFVEA